jgi:Fe2+ or Zn2+ uptake regulation protein
MNKRLATSSFCREASLPGDAKEFLRKVGLCSTRQRITVASLPLRDATRHVTAEILYEGAREVRCPVSTSAVCNALRQFEQAGLNESRPIGRSSLGL